MPSYAAWEYSVATHPRPTVKSPAGAMAVVRSTQPHYEGTVAGTVRAFTQRYNSAGITPTSKTEKLNSRSGASRAPGQTWATGPAAVGNPLLISDAGERTGGLGNRWTAPRPYAGIYVIDAEEVGTDDTTTTSATVGHYMSWAEHDPGLEGRHLRRRPRNKLWHYASYHSGGNALLSSGRNRRNWHCFETRRYAKYYQNPNDDALTLLAGGALRTLAAAPAGVGTVTAALGVRRAMAAAPVGISTVATDVRVTRGLAATPAGVGTVTADLTKVGGLVRSLAATVVGTSVVSGALNVSRRLAATPVGSGIVTASLRVTRRFNALVTGISTVTGNFRNTRGLAARATGVGIVSATRLTVQRRLASITTGAAAIAANLTIIGQLPSFVGESIQRFRQRKRWAEGGSGDVRRRGR